MTEKSSNPKGGPRTADGKSRSALNNFRHGLAGLFRLRKDESKEEFDNFLAGLRDEYEPATATEELLVQKMAEHTWLIRRARDIQDYQIEHGGPAIVALMLRYETTHDRNFHKCLNELREIQKERIAQTKNKKQEFESQLAAAVIEFESQERETPLDKSCRDMVSHLRKLLGDLCPASDEGVLALFRRSLMRTFASLNAEAAS